MAVPDPRTITVLIPAYNEEKNVGRVAAELRAAGYRVLCVDDGSADRTALEAERAGAEVIRLHPNRGKGGALKAGIAHFLRTSAGTLVMMDADGQHDPADLPKLLDPIAQGKAALVVGDRMGDVRSMPGLRVATNRFMSGLLSLLAGQRISDSQCGYRAVTADALGRMRLDTDRFEIESEMLLEAARLKYRIASVPVRSVYEGGPSHIQPGRDTLRFIAFLFRRLTRPRS